jgi:hypothetical protein
MNLTQENGMYEAFLQYLLDRSIDLEDAEEMALELVDEVKIVLEED